MNWSLSMPGFRPLPPGRAWFLRMALNSKAIGMLYLCPKAGVFGIFLCGRDGNNAEGTHFLTSMLASVGAAM